MLTREGIDNNLCFLILEVRKQLQTTRRFLEAPSESLIEAILSHDDYVDNLRSTIQRKCFSQVATLEVDDPQVHFLKAIDVVSSNLERIGDFCEDIVNQARHIQRAAALGAQDFGPFFDEVLAGLDRVDKALFSRNVQIALRVCRAEHNLDRLYSRHLMATVDQLKTGANAHDLVTIAFIYHYFERMGDALLNVGEAVISACLGERIKISRFWALEDSLGGARLDETSRPVALAPVADTRSGSRISRVDGGAAEGGRAVIFKEGRLAKLRAERANIDRWHAIMPGLAPRVHSFHEHGENGATLFEYLSGRTFEELLLSGSAAEVRNALGRICDTIAAVWQKTVTPEPAAARFARQLASRLSDVFAVHSGFETPGQTIGTLPVRSLRDLLALALPLDEALVAPFSVFIHGDLNVDNLIFDAERDEVHFVDLHRSARTDYVQDVSVFLVSNYRLQALENPVRARLNYVMEEFYRFALDFAQRSGDALFEARLCLGLARSFATSTRFVLAPSMAKSMFLRARYLLEQLVARSGNGLADLRVPMEVLLE